MGLKKPALRNGAARINLCVPAGKLGTLGKTKPVSRLVVEAAIQSRPRAARSEAA
jgi:hypothetical protein